MDSFSGSSGSVPGPAKCRLLSVNEKRELVRELSKSPGTAVERMNKWTRRDIMKILCAELGDDDIKFEALSKDRMLDHLFKVVNGTIRPRQKNVGNKSSPDLDENSLQSPCKIQRRTDSRMARALTNNAYICQNSACRATLNPEDKFCRRCSCCICFKYDYDKDPTLWLFCTSDDSMQGDTCGLSCHLECALKDERSGILQSGSEQSKKLDGGYYCTHCGKQNDLLGCWKTQLLVAKNARRLNELFYRISLSHKLLVSTEKYLVLHAIVDTAMKKLEAEIGPITDTQDMGHGIVGRFPVAVEVQKLCTCAIEALQSMLSSALTADSKTQRSCVANCDEPTSKTHNTKLGDHGETEAAGLKKSPRVSIPAALHEEHEIPRPGAQSVLIPGRSGDSGGRDGLSEPNSPAKTSLHLDSSNLILNDTGNLQNLNADTARLENESAAAQTECALACQQPNHGSLVVPITENEEVNEASAASLKPKSDYQTAPSKLETEPGDSSNKSPCVKLAVIGNNKAERSEASYEYCIKVIRHLEREGHIEAEFRMKFLTWFCLRATPHGRRTVGAFVDNLIDDPASLASQLVDTFSDAIYNRRPHPVQPGFCMELWH